MGSGQEAALVLVATPIGNLGDLSPRAATELRQADVICCEDTRRTGKLLELTGISRTAPLLRVDDHTEARRIGDVLERLGRGERVVVVTDAGTPGISDPGERLVRAAIDAGFRIEIVPGASAAIAALVASGLPTGRFAFEGFLPRRGKPRLERLEGLRTESRTIILYEAPHRLRLTVADLLRLLGADRRVVIARELTKLHEEIWRGSLADALRWVVEHEPKGEVVIVVEGVVERPSVSDDAVERAVRAALARGLTTRDAVDEASLVTGVPRRRAYAIATGMAPPGGGPSVRE